MDRRLGTGQFIEAWDHCSVPGLLKGRILVYVWMLFLHVKLVYYPV